MFTSSTGDKMSRPAAAMAAAGLARHSAAGADRTFANHVRDQTTTDRIVEWRFFRPRLWRLIAAFSVAPLVSSIAASVVAALYAAMAGIHGSSPLGDFLDRIILIDPFAMLLAMILGLPLYALLVGRVRPTVYAAALGGMAILLLPYFVALFRFWSESNEATVSLLASIAGVGLLGSIGGMTFWICAVWRDQRLGSEGAIQFLNEEMAFEDIVFERMSFEHMSFERLPFEEMAFEEMPFVVSESIAPSTANGDFIFPQPVDSAFETDRLAENDSNRD
jgi:hypothetical protein